MFKRQSFVLLTSILVSQFCSSAGAQQQQVSGPMLKVQNQQLEAQNHQLKEELQDAQEKKTSVDGTNVGSFFSSGAQVNPMDMEKASIPADDFVNLPPWHKVKLETPAQAAKHGKGLGSSLGRAFAHTCNFIGFPVGDDHDVDASLSSDLPNEENQLKNQQLEAAQREAASQRSSQQ